VLVLSYIFNRKRGVTWRESLADRVRVSGSVPIENPVLANIGVKLGFLSLSLLLPIRQKHLIV
jgi:hypothetical protein